MDREFVTTVDSEGHIEIPADMRERHGLRNGARVKVEERGKDVVISPVEFESLSDLAGILTKGDPVAELLKDRALDKAREDEKFRPR